MLTHLRPALAGLAVATVLATSPAFAETVAFKADLKGSNAVPPVNSPGTGAVAITYDTTSKRLSWKGSYSGLTGSPTAAHFHGPADPSKNAGVLVPAPNIAGGSFEGSATLTDDQARMLEAGQLYFNIHTAAHPGGELRGQVVKGQ